MTIVRPCIVFGPNVDNYLVRLWTQAPFQPDFGGNLDQLIQFVHEDDLVDAIVGLLDGRHGGAFNVTGDGSMTMRETAEVTGTKVRKMPLRLATHDQPSDVASRHQRDPARADRVRDEPVGLLEREGEGDARLAAALHDPRDVRDLTMQAHSGASRS